MVLAHPVDIETDLVGQLDLLDQIVAAAPLPKLQAPDRQMYTSLFPWETYVAVTKCHSSIRRCNRKRYFKSGGIASAASAEIASTRLIDF